MRSPGINGERELRGNRLTQVHLEKWPLRRSVCVNIVKHIQTCKYLGYCSQIFYNSSVPFNLFQFLWNVTNFIFPHYMLTCWRMAITSWLLSSCVDKQILAKEDSVLIKVLKSQKRILREKKNQRIYIIWGILQERVYHCQMRDINHLKEWLIEEWRHFDHGIIDRAVNQCGKWLQRCIRENGGHFQQQLWMLGLLSLSGLTAAVWCSLIFGWFCLQFYFWVWVTVIFQKL